MVVVPLLAVIEGISEVFDSSESFIPFVLASMNILPEIEYVVPVGNMGVKFGVSAGVGVVCCIGVGVGIGVCGMGLSVAAIST